MKLAKSKDGFQIYWTGTRIPMSERSRNLTKRLYEDDKLLMECRNEGFVESVIAAQVYGEHARNRDREESEISDIRVT